MRAGVGVVVSLPVLLGLPPLCAGTASAQEVQGFAEARAHYLVGVDGTAWELIERFRPSFSADVHPRMTLNATVEASLHQGRDTLEEVERIFTTSEAWPTLEAQGVSFPEGASNAVLGVSTATDYLRVERLHLDVYLPFADVRVGRQAVNWGSALMVNPTDPFPEVLLTEPWRPRAGVNAARVTVPVDERAQVQAVVGSNDDFTAVRAAGRGTVNLGAADLSLVGAWRPEANDSLVGLDVKGTFGVGYWLEGAIHIERGRGVTEEVAVGLDYSFPVLQSLIVAAQYYHNGAGEKVQEDPLEAFTASLEGDADATADPFAPFLKGRDYTVTSVSVGITPEVSASALWVQNLGDGSGLVVPVVTTTPTGWLEVSATAQLPVVLWGEGGELSPNPEDLRLAIPDGDGAPMTVDLSGLVPAATLILWTRVNF